MYIFYQERLYKMIIDVHVHLGWDFTFDENFTRESLINKMNKYKVNIQIVQPGTCHDLQSVVKQHESIAEICKEFPGHFYGMANPSPHLDVEAYNDEISRCIEDLGFIAIKIHPMAHGVIPNSKSGRKAFDAARKYKVPLMVHTGSGVPFAGPVNLIKMSKEYCDLKIILAHCGQIIFSNEAEAVFSACPNAYGDTSWTPGFTIKSWLKSYGERFMLASDHADNFGTELSKVQTVGFNESEQKSILETTAMKVFNLKKNI